MNEIKPYLLHRVCEKRTFSAQLYGEFGAIVVCLHGFPDNYLTFRYQVPALVHAGYRVLVPVMPGYEVSSVDPDQRYQVTDLVRWLLDWLDFLEADAVHLVGHDWGAVTGWLALAMAPDRFHTFTSIAIPSLRHMPRAVARHPLQVFRSWYMGLFQLPAVAERAIAAGDGWLIRQLWQRWSPGWQAPQDHLGQVCHDLLQPGVTSAALAYYRCLLRLFDPAHRQGRYWLGQTLSQPVLMISGARDGCMDTALFDTALVDADFPGGVELYRLMGAGHFCHLEKPELVNRRILGFLQAHSRNRARAGAPPGVRVN